MGAAPPVLLVATQATFERITKKGLFGQAVTVPAWCTPEQARAQFRFDLGHPSDGTAYVDNPVLAGHYLLPAHANERMAQEKLAAFSTIAAHLGARTVRLVSAELRSESKQMGVSLPAVAKQLGLSAALDASSGAQRSVYAEFGAPDRPPSVPEAMRPWLDMDPALRHLAELRLTRPPTSFSMALEVRDVFQLSGALELLGKHVEIGGKLRTVGHTVWQFEIVFWPVQAVRAHAAHPPARLAKAPQSPVEAFMASARAGDVHAAVAHHQEVRAKQGAAGLAELRVAVCDEDVAVAWHALAQVAQRDGDLEALTEACEIGAELGDEHAWSLLERVARFRPRAGRTALWHRLARARDAHARMAALLELLRAHEAVESTRKPGNGPPLAPATRFVARRILEQFPTEQVARDAQARWRTDFDQLGAAAWPVTLELLRQEQRFTDVVAVLERAIDLEANPATLAEHATVAAEVASTQLQDAQLAADLYDLALLALLGGPRPLAFADGGTLRPPFDPVIRAVDGLTEALAGRKHWMSVIAAYRETLARLPADYNRLRQRFARSMASVYRAQLSDEAGARRVLRRYGVKG